MKIKRLELVGFKSFVDPTVIDFEAPIIAVVGPNGSGKCVTGATLVPLSNGKIVPIRSLIDSAFEQAESIEKMDDGEYTYDNPDDVQVLSLDPNTLRMTARPVLAFVRRKSPETLLKIKTRSGRKITATKYHPLFAWQEGRLRAIRADELKEGMSIAAPRHLPVHATQTHFMAMSDPSSDGGSELVAVDNVLMTRPSRTLPLKMHASLTPDWGRFLGYIISEGQNSAWSHQVRFVNSDPDVVEDFCRVTERIFDRRPVVKDYKEGAKDCLLFSSILCNLLDLTFGIERGGHSSTKRVPSLIFSAPDDVAWAFISALVEGDGYIQAKTSVTGKQIAYLEYASASETLARGLATLLLRFGIHTQVCAKQKKATNGRGISRTYYSVYVYGAEQLKILARHLTLVSQRKRTRLEEAASIESKPNPNHDVLPLPVTEEFSQLWDRANTSIQKEHPLRGRAEVYRQGGCQPSRKGLGEAVEYIRTHAGRWNPALEAQAGHLERLATSDIYWDTISEIEEVKGEEWVYDLCVEETHNFVANDLIVHNSNIVDSIRWVMGEMSAKSLRGKGMEDVIFNGSDSRPPVGMAEVSFTFSTGDGIVPTEYAAYSEITITRRLYRSGESEYLINKIPSRLRDIIELFLGTGVGHRAYSVIEQGRIDYAINAKPDDRRLLIEEAAGISKFKARKEAALRKIEGAEQNLARLRDILREVTRQIGSLDRQVKKAEKYKNLKTQLRELELKLSALSYLEQTQEVEELRSLLKDWSHREGTAAARLAALETDLQTKRIELTEKDRELSELQEKYFGASSQLQLAETKDQFQRKELTSVGEQIARSEGEIAQLKEQVATLEKERRLLETKAQELARADSALTLLQKTEQEWRELTSLKEEATHTLEQVQQQLQGLSKSETTLEGDERIDTERARALEAEIAKVLEKGQSVRDQEAERHVILEKLNQEIQAASQSLRTLKDAVEALREEASSQREKKELLDHDLKLRQEELVQKRSRIKSLLDLEKNFEGYDEGVRTLLKARKAGTTGLAGIVGVVADFMEAPAEYETAVSAALGEKLQYVIVKSHEEGLSAIHYLKEQAGGRSAFIPIEVRDRQSDPFPYVQDGVLGPLLAKVRLKEEYRAIAQLLLGDVVLVRSLEDALSLWRANGHKKTLVTLEGEVIDPNGVVSGGTVGVRGKILLEKKRELKDLRAEVASLEEQIGLQEDAVNQMEGQLSERTLRASETEEKIHEGELLQKGRETEQEHLREELQELRISLEKIESEKKDLENSRQALTASLQERARQKGELLERKNQVGEDVRHAEELLTLLADKERALSERVTQMRIDTGSLAERKTNLDREIQQSLKREGELRQTVEEKTSEIAEAHQRIASLHQSLEELQGQRKELAELVTRLSSAQEELKGVYDRLASETQKIEENLKGARKEGELARSHSGDLRVTLSRLEGEIDHLQAQMLEKYSVSLSEIAPQYREVPCDRPAEEAGLAEIKAQLEKLGDVNLGAIPEYEELGERQKFLQEQIQDLERSLEAIAKAITRINQTTRKRFEETFALVNERFQSLVPRLFRGGRAELRLITDGDFQNGVELFVQPPGKKLSHVGLLSGGEKAMTAIAFVFSIFLVKPSPFCILDEVDAPLDDTNVDRFHQLLAEMTPRSQFILITHNRRTMERADLLYGITMQEPGISKVVSVRLSETLPLAS